MKELEDEACECDGWKKQNIRYLGKRPKMLTTYYWFIRSRRLRLEAFLVLLSYLNCGINPILRPPSIAKVVQFE
jgi:hypothetical protein